MTRFGYWFKSLWCEYSRAEALAYLALFDGRPEHVRAKAAWRAARRWRHDLFRAHILTPRLCEDCARVIDELCNLADLPHRRHTFWPDQAVEPSELGKAMAAYNTHLVVGSPESASDKMWLADPLGFVRAKNLTYAADRLSRLYGCRWLCEYDYQAAEQNWIKQQTERALARGGAGGPT